MTFRKTIFWLHLISGCVAGVIVLIMSVTGVLLTYERQTIDWFDRGLRAPQQAGRPRMPLEAILAAQPAAPTTVTLRADPNEPVMLTYGREGTVYVDAYTGATLGKGHSGVRKFFQSMTSWHRWLGQEGPGRQTARAITGACNLAFLFLVMSGLVLWWPRRWTAASLRAGPRSVSMKPAIEASGVRSSWLALAMKSARMRSIRRASLWSLNTRT